MNTIDQVQIRDVVTGEIHTVDRFTDDKIDWSGKIPKESLGFTDPDEVGAGPFVLVSN